MTDLENAGVPYLFTIRETARALNVSKMTVYRLCERRQLRGYRVAPGRVRVEANSVAKMAGWEPGEVCIKNGCGDVLWTSP